MTIYRKIYEAFYGPIPTDEDGRTYEIHHIDGDQTNNSILNLVALTIQDHYDVHYIQGDYGACWFIANKMGKSKEEIAEISRKRQLALMEAGTHPFCDKERQRELGKRSAAKRLKNGTHNFTSEHARNFQMRRVKQGKHNLMRENRATKTCPVCNKTMFLSHYGRYGHGEDCRSRVS